MSQSKSAVPDPVQIAGRFDIVSKLGAGAFGTVYKAKDSLLGRMVAIKTIRLEGLAAQGAGLEEMLERFGREARVAAQLKHPNIVTIYDFGTDQGMSYLAMEFIDGIGLDRLIANEGKLPTERAAMIGAQVADALDFAHRQSSVVHRDIKPANIMIEAGDRVKVTDFGIAKATDSGEHLTMTGSLLGTPSYMSPEQARGSALDGRSDLFALGCVLYEMVTGKKAFRGESITGLIFKIITEEPPSMTDADPRIPEGMIKIVAKALAKTPETRYQTGKEMAEDLTALTRGGAFPTVRQTETPTARPGVLGPGAAAETINTAAATAVGGPAVPAPTVRSDARPGAPKPPTPPPPPAPRPTPPPPPPPSARAPQPAKSGGGAGIVIGILAVLFLGAVIVVGGGWWFFTRRGPQTAGDTQPTSAPPLVTEATPGPADSASPGPATEAPTLAAETASPATPEPASSGHAKATFPPATTQRNSGRSGGNRGATADASGREVADNTDSDSSGGNADYAYLDEEKDASVDGEAGGRRVADAYRSGQGSSSSGSAFGTGGHLHARPRSPRDLMPHEKPAVGTLRYVMNAEEAYHHTHKRYGTLSDLLADSMRLDVRPSGNAFARRGYHFTLTAKDDGFQAIAVPQQPGLRPFHGDDSGYIQSGLD